jgi:hypothetical protein
VPPCTQYADVVVSQKRYSVHPDIIALYTAAYKENAGWAGKDANVGNNRKVQDFVGKRLIFVKDVSASTLFASVAGAMTFAASLLF